MALVDGKTVQSLDTLLDSYWLGLKVGNHEKRIVNHELHKISKAIVEEARQTNSVIALGELKGLRKNKTGKGRRLNRKLSSHIEYKAKWIGIPVLKVDEAYTSQTCSICNGKGVRYKGLFKCPCGAELNADYNAAKNILKRALGLMSSAGAEVNQPITTPNVETPSDRVG